MADASGYRQTDDNDGEWFLLSPDAYPRPELSDRVAEYMARFEREYTLNPETAGAFVKATGLPYFTNETAEVK